MNRVIIILVLLTISFNTYSQEDIVTNKTAQVYYDMILTALQEKINTDINYDQLIKDFGSMLFIYVNEINPIRLDEVTDDGYIRINISSIMIDLSIKYRISVIQAKDMVREYSASNTGPLYDITYNDINKHMYIRFKVIDK